MQSSENVIEATVSQEKNISGERVRRHRGKKHKSFRLAEMREHLGDVVNLAAFAGERVVLTRYGRPVVAVVPLEDMQWLDSLKGPQRKRGQR